MIRNAAGQSTLIGPLELIADGSAVAAGAAISTRIAGSTAAGAGTLAHVAGGIWEYAPTQAETDTPALGLVLSAAGARSVGLAIETTRLPVQTAPGSANGLPVLDGSGTLGVDVDSIAGSTLAANNLKADEEADPPTIPTAGQVATATWQLPTTGNEPTGSFGAFVAGISGGSGGTLDYAAMEAYFAAHGGLSANAIAVAGNTLAATHLRDDELAPPPTIPTAADNAAAVWAASARGLTDKAGFGLAAGERASVADAVLTRDWTAISGTVPARCALQALRWLRNAWSIVGTTLIVRKEDDVATAWTKPVTEDATADPVTGAGAG